MYAVDYSLADVTGGTERSINASKDQLVHVQKWKDKEGLVVRKRFNPTVNSTYQSSLHVEYDLYVCVCVGGCNWSAIKGIRGMSLICVFFFRFMGFLTIISGEV